MAVSAVKAKTYDFSPKSFRDECFAIADWWLTYSVDKENGGFYGQVAHDNIPLKTAPKCIILNARILWFFSEVARFSGDEAYKQAAQRAYEYLLEHFFDRVHGGFLWEVSAEGELLNGRKQIYAQAFAIYALSAYFDLTHESAALDLAYATFSLVESNAKDPVLGGYFEAYSQAWGSIEDVRLSAKEDNSPKTMNTHLHVLEAYTALNKSVRHHPHYGAPVQTALEDLLTIFSQRVVDQSSGHVRMFMGEDWRDRSHAYSFGHDIETSWLMLEAMKSLAADDLTPDHLALVKNLARVSLRNGLRDDGGMGDLFDLKDQSFNDTCWWVQAEAMVGFVTMWSMGEGDQYLTAAENIWQYVQKHHFDYDYGEWYWFSKYDQDPRASEYKVGAWKAPYHNGRAMMQLYKLLSRSAP